ncbi:MAG TPA: hypothetical protein VGD84_12455 [Pseudonocardiaceae bacterium]
MPNSALLVMDVQKSIVERFPDQDYLPRLGKAIETARAAHIPVIYVVVGLREGRPEAHPRNSG